MFNATWGIPIALGKEVGSTFKGFAYATDGAAVKLDSFARQREAGATSAFLLDLANLFEQWLTAHITREDRRFGAYLAALPG